MTTRTQGSCPAFARSSNTRRIQALSASLRGRSAPPIVIVFIAFLPAHFLSAPPGAPTVTRAVILRPRLAVQPACQIPCPSYVFESTGNLTDGVELYLSCNAKRFATAQYLLQSA